MAGVGLQWAATSGAFKPSVTRKMKRGRHQLIKGKGGGGGAASISMQRRWPKAPIANGTDIKRRWQRSCSVRRLEVGEGSMGLGWAGCKNKRKHKWLLGFVGQNEGRNTKIVCKFLVASLNGCIKDI
jgi:hypothetical protein